MEYYEIFAGTLEELIMTEINLSYRAHPAPTPRKGRRGIETGSS